MTASTREIGLGTTILLTQDVARAFASLGLGVSLRLSQQRFETAGVAPSRLSLAPYFALVGMLGVDVGHGFQLAGDGRLESYLLRVDDSGTGQSSWVSDFAVRGSFRVAKLFLDHPRSRWLQTTASRCVDARIRDVVGLVERQLSKSLHFGVGSLVRMLESPFTTGGG